MCRQGGKFVCSRGWATPITYLISFSNLFFVIVGTFDYDRKTPTGGIYYAATGVMFSDNTQFRGGGEYYNSKDVWIAFGI